LSWERGCESGDGDHEPIGAVRGRIDAGDSGIRGKVWTELIPSSPEAGSLSSPSLSRLDAVCSSSPRSRMILILGPNVVVGTNVRFLLDEADEKSTWLRCWRVR
jgi:hypothetical protein